MGIIPSLFFEKVCDFFNEVPGRPASRLKKISQTFSKKTIDISSAVCYTYIKIRKGEKIMKNIIYMSTLTGECTENHKDAVALFNEGHDIDIMGWSDALGEWICRMTWEH